jgi:hypothetical protein
MEQYQRQSLLPGISGSDGVTNSRKFIVTPIPQNRYRSDAIERDPRLQSDVVGNILSILSE